MQTTHDVALADRTRRLLHHDQSGPSASSELGFDYRRTDLSAPLGLARLCLSSALPAQRRRTGAYLTANLRGVETPPPPQEASAVVWHQYTIRVPGLRDQLASWLREREIEAGVYYPTLLPEQPLYTGLGLGGG